MPGIELPRLLGLLPLLHRHLISAGLLLLPRLQRLIDLAEVHKRARLIAGEVDHLHHGLGLRR